MLHNSTFRRELLREMNRNPLVLARREVHRHVGRRAGEKAGAGQMEMSGAWSVRAARDMPAEHAAVADASDFLARMGVKIDPSAKQQVLLEVGSTERGFRCVVDAGRVEVHGESAAALWAGWVHLEHEMRAAGGPFLPRGELRREPAWETQIAPPTWGANYAVPDLSEEYVGNDTFRSLAHAGADGMFVYGEFLLYAGGTRFAELNHPDADKHLATMRAASERAAAYGVRLYYVAVGPKLPADHALFKRLPDVRGAKLSFQPSGGSPPLHCLCSSSDQALGFHADVFARMFREVPQLGGLVLIIGGESYYHCFMRAAGSAIGTTNCAKCNGKVPEEVIARLLKTTAGAVRSAKPQAEVYAWPYSAQYFWSNEPHQLKLIDQLPENVGLLTEIDKDQIVVRGGYPKRIWDYSVDYDEHSDRSVAQALRCAQRDRPLAIKTETSHGIELLHLAYVPAIGRSARQWQSVRALRPRMVLQRWGFIGMFDSVAERIGYQARWDPDFAPEATTARVARQVLGAAAHQVVAAWKHFDDAVHHIPVLTTGAYYCGPAFLGPCHPLPVWDSKDRVPDAFRGTLFYLLEAEPTGTDISKRPKDDLTLTATHQLGGEVPVTAIESEFALARDAAQRGYELLAKIDASTLPPHEADELAEQRAIGECLYRTFRATVNTIRFVRLIEEAKGDRESIRPKLVDIAQDELANAKAAKTMYDAAPWLNHKLRLDVGMPDSLDMLAEKVRLLEAFVR